MPELPEVETYVQELTPLLQGSVIQRTQVFWKRTIAVPDADAFAVQVVGHRIERLSRRGKYILMTLDGGLSLIVHLRMTGELRVVAGDQPPHPHLRVRLELRDGRLLCFTDQRKFGRIWLVPDPEQVLYKLGPEPLDAAFTPDLLAQALVRRRSSIKALLLDQSVVAGVGNIYADEALFGAQIDPRRGGNTLSEAEVVGLWESIRTVLQQGIALRGSSLQNYAPPSGEKGSFQERHAVFRKNGQPCPRCGETIERVRLVQRSTHFCPGCQR